MGTGRKICKFTTGIGGVVSHSTIQTASVLEVLCWISSSVATIFLKNIMLPFKEGINEPSSSRDLFISEVLGVLVLLEAS